MQLPQGFLEYISRYPQLAPLKEGLTGPRSVSVRHNPAKAGLPDPDSADMVAWCPAGEYLPERKAFTFDPKLHQGRYYVQEASSMSLWAVIKQICGDKPARYLDTCAAPGGKTTLAISALPPGSVVVANEYDYKRAEILAENIAKWGYPDTAVSRGDVSRLAKLGEVFDIVAVDAPCSGEGMMRKEAKASEQWSEELVRQCARTQRAILSDAWKCLKPGGHLIYSTCTFNRQENEDNLAWLADTIGAEPIAVDTLRQTPGITGGIDTPYPCYRFLPGKTRGEGLFVCLVRKPGEESYRGKKRAKPDKAPKDTWGITRWFDTEMEAEAIGNELYALPKANAGFLRQIARNLDILSVGTHAATVKGRDIIPAHEAALCTAISRTAFPGAEVDLDNAIRYLRRDSITLPGDTPRGIVMLTYAGLPLGFVKNLGNRCNNLLPKNWRILSQQPDNA